MPKNLVEHFSIIEDPRRGRVAYDLTEILVIVTCALFAEDLQQMLVHSVRRILLTLDGGKQAVEAVKKGLRVLRSFLGSIKVSAGDVDITLGIDPEIGQADSCVLEADITDLLLTTGRAAQAMQRPVALLIDELQYVSRDELAALIRGIHAVNQAGLPLILFGACLPQLAGQAGDAKSYADRLFDSPDWTNLVLIRK